MSFDEEKRAIEADLQDLHGVRGLDDEEKRAIETTCRAEMERGGDIDVAGVVAAFMYRRDERDKREGQARRDEARSRRAMEQRPQGGPPSYPGVQHPTGTWVDGQPRTPYERYQQEQRDQRIRGQEGGD